MDKPTPAMQVRDIDAYEDNISLCRIPYQTVAATHLDKIAESIHYDRYTNSRTRLPNLLLVGKTSKRLCSRALANDLGFSYEEHDLHSVSYGCYSGTLYIEAEPILYHLRITSDAIIPSCISQLAFWMSHGYIRQDDKTIIRKHNKIFCYSVADRISDVPHLLLDHIDHIIELKSYHTTEEIAAIIESRLTFMPIGFDDDATLYIAEKAQSVARAIFFVRTAIVLVRSDCRSHIKLEDAKKAVTIASLPVLPSQSKDSRRRKF